MIPYAGQTVIALVPEHYAAIERTVALLDGIAHSASYQAEVDAGADAGVRFEPGNRGVFMGYDFHLGSDGPAPTEIYTNAGGALLNGLHTASLCDPERLGSVFCLGMNLDERRLPRNEFTLIEIHDLDDIDQLVQLFQDLFENALVSGRHDRHLRDRGVKRGADRDGLDIEAPAAEQP